MAAGSHYFGACNEQLGIQNTAAYKFCNDQFQFN